MPNELIWNGHSCFIIKSQGQTLVIDPFFEGNPKAVISAKSLGKIDYVLVTHDHGDHIGQALDICLDTGAKLLGVVETCHKLNQQGLPQDQTVNGIGINIGGTVSLGPAKATMIQAEHSSDSGRPAGYILTLGNGYTIYHAGDTGLFGAMGIYGKLFRIDLALLPIGGVFTMDPRQAAVACKLLRCRQVIPMHWGTFPMLEKGTTGFSAALDDLGVDCRLVPCQPGQSIGLEEPLPGQDCACP
jgi:L-ascorbate metabolism protein UlaG (beta-lactamase superfamily)